MLRMFAVGEGEEFEAAADFDGAASAAAAGIDASPRLCADMSRAGDGALVVVPESAKERQRLARSDGDDEERKRKADDVEGAETCSMAASIVEEEEQQLEVLPLPLQHLRAAANAALAAEARMM